MRDTHSKLKSKKISNSPSWIALYTLIVYTYFIIFCNVASTIYMDIITKVQVVQHTYSPVTAYWIIFEIDLLSI